MGPHLSAFSYCHSRNIKSSVDTQSLHTIIYTHHRQISHLIIIFTIPQSPPQYLNNSSSLVTKHLTQVSFISRSTASAARAAILKGQSNELERAEQRPLLPDADRLWATVLHAPALCSKSTQQGPFDVRVGNSKSCQFPDPGLVAGLRLSRHPVHHRLRAKSILPAVLRQMGHSVNQQIFIYNRRCRASHSNNF